MKKIVKSMLTIAALSLVAINLIDAKESKNPRRRRKPMSQQGMTQTQVNQQIEEGSSAILDPNASPEEKQMAAEQVKQAIQYSESTLEYARLLNERDVKEKEIAAKRIEMANLRKEGGWLYDSTEVRNKKTEAKKQLDTLTADLNKIKSQLAGQEKVIGSRSTIIKYGVAALTALGLAGAAAYQYTKALSPVGS